MAMFVQHRRSNGGQDSSAGSKIVVSLSLLPEAGYIDSTNWI